MCLHGQLMFPEGFLEINLISLYFISVFIFWLLRCVCMGGSCSRKADDDGFGD